MEYVPKKPEKSREVKCRTRFSTLQDQAARPVERLGHLRVPEALDRPHCTCQSDLKLELLPFALKRVRQIRDQTQSSLELREGLDESAFRLRSLAGSAPIRNRLLQQAGFAERMSQNFGLRLHQRREALFERLGDPRVQFLAWDAQQHAVGGVPDK